MRLAGRCLPERHSERADQGAFSFTAREVISTEETPATGVFVTTGDAQVDTGEGTLSCTMTGSIQIGGDGAFVSICVLTGGTGGWAGAAGYLRTSGTLVIASGGTGSCDGKVVS